MQKEAQEVKEIISLEQAKEDLQKIVGLTVSRTWKGYGSAIFLELGELHKEYQKWTNKDDGKNYSMKGDWTLWSTGGWCILKDNRLVVDGLEVKSKDIEQIIGQFNGRTITNFAIASDGEAVDFRFNAGVVLQLYKEDFGYFLLSYNHKPHLGFEDDGTISYDHNKL